MNQYPTLLPVLALCSSLLAQAQFRSEPVGAPAVVADAKFLDLDADGDQDVLLSRDAALFWLENDGSGNFTTRPLPATPVGISRLATGDFDRDGDEDAIALSPQATSSVLIAATPMGPNTTPLGLQSGYGGNYLASIDVDLDGDLDVVAAPSNGSPVLLRNDGSGNFTTDMPFFGGTTLLGTAGVHVGDFNGDGAPDLFFAGLLSSQMMLNDGAGNLSPSVIGAHVHGLLSSVAVADFTGDGLDDLFVIRLVGAGGYLLISDGLGGLVPGGTTPTDGWPAVQAVDIDQDGDFDVVGCTGVSAISSGANGFAVLLNDGTGAFTEGTAQRVTTIQGRYTTLALGDADGDGDVDAFIGGEPRTAAQQELLIRNYHRQVSVTAQGRIGGEAVVLCSAEPGYATAMRLAILALGPAAATPLASPFGTLHLDPTTATTLPFLLLQPPAGEALVRLPIPNNPVLAGAELLVQGALLDPAGSPLRLTGFARIRVLP